MITTVFMFGNRMLLTSLLSVSLFSLCLTGFIDLLFIRVSNEQSFFSRFLIIIRRAFLFCCSFIIVKFLIINQLFSSPDDDAHIWDILKSKLFPPFQTFDTQLYTCAKEFDFIELETIVQLCQTGLIPLGSLILFVFLCRFVIDVFGQHHDQEQIHLSNHYHLIQTVVYILMGLLIMRLKLFSVPQLCLLVSHFMNESLWPKKIVSKKKWKFTLFVGILAIMSFQGINNIREQLKIRGELLMKTKRSCFF